MSNKDQAVGGGEEGVVKRVDGEAGEQLCCMDNCERECPYDDGDDKACRWSLWEWAMSVVLMVANLVLLFIMHLHNSHLDNLGDRVYELEDKERSLYCYVKRVDDLRFYEMYCQQDDDYWQSLKSLMLPSAQ